jgi:hypothetical protein
MTKNNKKNKEGMQKGGDGYVINPSINIAGMTGHTRYSYNLIPVFSGELLEDGNGYNSDPTMQNIECTNSKMQNGGSIKKNKKNCGCDGIIKNKKTKDEKSIFDLIKLQGGNPEISNISQFGAIQSVSKILQPLGINNLLVAKQS